jgi:hypothetical protein
MVSLAAEWLEAFVRLHTEKNFRITTMATAQRERTG